MRHRFQKYVLAILLALLSAIWALPRSPAPPLIPVGTLTAEGGVPVLQLWGSPYEMGAQQGTLLRQPLREFVRNCLYDGFLCANPSTHANLLAWARDLDRSFPVGVRREIEGIADGAGLSYSDVLLLNVVPDYVCLAGTLPGDSTSAPPTDATDNCGLASAAFAAWGRSTYGGKLIMGCRTSLQWDAGGGERWMLVVRRPMRGNASVSVSRIGSVGVWFGVTENALSAALLPSPSVDVAANGQLLSLVLRQALDGSVNLDSAIDAILGSARVCGGNLILGDSTAPEARLIELSAHRHAQLSASETDQLVTCANHFIDPELAVTQRDMRGERDRQETESGLRRLKMALERNLGWIGTEKAEQLVGEAGGGSSGLALALGDHAEPSCLLQGVLLSYDQLTLLLESCPTADPGGRTRLELRTLFAGGH